MGSTPGRPPGPCSLWKPGIYEIWNMFCIIKWEIKNLSPERVQEGVSQTFNSSLKNIHRVRELVYRASILSSNCKFNLICSTDYALSIVTARYKIWVSSKRKKTASNNRCMFKEHLINIERIETGRQSAYYCLLPGSRNAALQCKIFYCILFLTFLSRKTNYLLFL